jgi:hypothetical protein
MMAAAPGWRSRSGGRMPERSEFAAGEPSGPRSPRPAEATKAAAQEGGPTVTVWRNQSS